MELLTGLQFKDSELCRGSGGGQIVQQLGSTREKIDVGASLEIHGGVAPSKGKEA